MVLQDVIGDYVKAAGALPLSAATSVELAALKFGLQILLKFSGIPPLSISIAS